MHIAINKVFLVPLANPFRDDLKNVKFNDHEAKHSHHPYVSAVICKQNGKRVQRIFPI